MNTETPSGSGNKVFPMPLSHFISSAGIASRRKSTELVKNGKIKVNGKIITEPGFRVQSGDKVEFENRRLEIGKRLYVMLNKPRSYVCTNKDPHAPKKALDLIEIPGIRLFSAGRLDKESEGLIIFTNDGDYSDRLSHPRYGILKTYEVETDTEIPLPLLAELRKGITSNGEELRAASIRKISPTSYIFRLNEGKKREIRRMIEYTKRKTVSLKRIAIGKLSLENLPSGKWRFLSDIEIQLSLKN